MVSDVILLSASLNARKTVKRFINSIGGKQYSEYSYINCNDHACQHCDKSFHYRGVLSITITINNKKNDNNSWHGTVLSTKQNLDGLSIGMVGFCRWAMGSKVGSLLSHFQMWKIWTQFWQIWWIIALQTILWSFLFVFVRWSTLNNMV